MNAGSKGAEGYLASYAVEEQQGSQVVTVDSGVIPQPACAQIAKIV